MWTMKCFSRETDREILSDFILLGQIISSHQLFCSLSLFSLFFFRQPPSFVFVVGVLQRPRKLENQEKKKETKKTFRHVKRVALIKLYPFHNTIINTYTHKVVVLCFEWYASLIKVRLRFIVLFLFFFFVVFEEEEEEEDALRNWFYLSKSHRSCVIIDTKSIIIIIARDSRRARRNWPQNNRRMMLNPSSSRLVFFLSSS